MPTAWVTNYTNRQALYLTTIITVASTILLLKQTAAMLTANFNLTVTALPVAH
jgi:hypothetical protein